MFPTRRIITSGGDVYRDQYSLEFDGTDDYITTGTGIDLGSTTDFTITCWAKAADWTDQMFMGKWQDVNYRWFLGVNGSDYLSFYSLSNSNGGITYTGTTALTNGEWTHIAFVADRSADSKGYINGVLDDTDTTEVLTRDLDNTGVLVIGASGVTAGNPDYITGNISEVSIWNTALSSNQVKQLYNGREPFDARNVAKSNLVSYWRMGDGTERGAGTTIYDMSANANNGTMTNMDAATDYTGDTPA